MQHYAIAERDGLLTLTSGRVCSGSTFALPSVKRIRIFGVDVRSPLEPWNSSSLAIRRPLAMLVCPPRYCSLLTACGIENILYEQLI